MNWNIFLPTNSTVDNSRPYCNCIYLFQNWNAKHGSRAASLLQEERKKKSGTAQVIDQCSRMTEQYWSDKLSLLTRSCITEKKYKSQMEQFNLYLSQVQALGISPSPSLTFPKMYQCWIQAETPSPSP